VYPGGVPKLWTETIEEHRREVRDAILDTTAALVAEHGLLSVTMSQMAEQTGIGRATLYKYFPDVEAVLLAWHQRHVAGHLKQLAEIRDQAGEPAQRLKAVLKAYARICYDRGRNSTDEISALLHQHRHVARAQQHLNDLIRDVIADAATAGDVRPDVDPDVLASYCLHALAAARIQPSEAAVGQLLAVTLAGIGIAGRALAGRERA
jgi:AcrR family transcriptional regulator